MYVFGQVDCSDCPFNFQLPSDYSYCIELEEDCGETFEITFNLCPFDESGGDACSLCDSSNGFIQTYNTNITVLGSQVNGTKITFTFLAEFVEDTDCYTGCISFFPCGVECEIVGGCYENSLAYHRIIEVCGCDETEPCDDYELWECLSSSCECLSLCVDDTEVTFNNTSGGEDFICFPEGAVISNVVDCDEGLACSGPPYLPTKGRVIPEASIISYNTVSKGIDIDLILPESDIAYQLLISSATGEVVKKEKIYDSQNSIQLRDIPSGMYFVNIDNGTTVISHKLYLGN